MLDAIEEPALLLGDERTIAANAAARAGHTDIGDVDCASRQNAQITGLDVRVRPEKRTDQPIKRERQ